VDSSIWRPLYSRKELLTLALQHNMIKIEACWNSRKKAQLPLGSLALAGQAQPTNAYFIFTDLM
jgi:hypothetical protein